MTSQHIITHSIKKRCSLSRFYCVNVGHSAESRENLPYSLYISLQIFPLHFIFLLDYRFLHDMKALKLT